MRVWVWGWGWASEPGSHLFFFPCSFSVSVIMARQFGEVIHPSQCQNMCDVCDLLRPAANGSSQAAAAAAATPTPSVISRDFTEAALQICHLVVAANSAKEVDSGKAKGKRKRSSANVGTVTQKQLLDECKKRSSAVRHTQGTHGDGSAAVLPAVSLMMVLPPPFSPPPLFSHLLCRPSPVRSAIV